MKPDTDRLGHLLAQLVEETIEANELAELESLLDRNPEAQDHYFHYLGLHNDLQSSQHEDITTPEKPTSRRSFDQVAGAAAIILLGIGLLAWHPEERFATIDYGPVGWTVGETNRDRTQIGAGTLEALEANPAEVTSPMAPRSTLRYRPTQLKTQKRCLSAAVSPLTPNHNPPANPCVSSPLRRGEVLGTQFNVLANAYSTRLNVNEGLVKVKRLSDGSTEQVRPDHEITASLEAETDFVAKRREQSGIAWQSDLGRGHLVGVGALTAHGTVRAQTHLWRGDAKLGEKLEKPVLLHTITFHPSTERQPRIKIQNGQRFVLKGRTAQDGQVHVGFSANEWNGGLYGKYATSRKVTAPQFEIEIPLSGMKRTKSVFAEHPEGQELIHIGFSPCVGTSVVESGVASLSEPMGVVSEPLPTSKAKAPGWLLGVAISPTHGFLQPGFALPKPSTTTSSPPGDHSPFSRTLPLRIHRLSGRAWIDDRPVVTLIDTEEPAPFASETPSNRLETHRADGFEDIGLIATIAVEGGEVIRIRYNEERIKSATQRLHFAAKKRSQIVHAKTASPGNRSGSNGHGVPPERVNQLKRIAKTDLPEGYNPGAGRNSEESFNLHQGYVNRRMGSMSDRQRGLVSEMWKQQQAVNPSMPNRGAAFVKIMEHVANNELQ